MTDESGKPDYLGIGSNPAMLVVQKAHPLLLLSQSTYTLSDFKILDAYLSRINSHDPSKRWVRFSRGELEELLGVKQLRQEDLEARLDSLFSPLKFVNTPDGELAKEQLGRIQLFEFANCEIDENGQWQVDLICTETAMKYIFHPEVIGYIKYKLQNIMRIKSRYTYLMYMYLEQQKTLHVTWSVSVDDMRYRVLQCDPSKKSYANFSEFNDKILKKVQRDLQEFCPYSYRSIRNGRRVVSLQIRIIRQDASVPQLPPDPQEQISEDYDDDALTCFLVSALCQSATETCEFTPTQIREIRHIVMMIPEDRLQSIEEMTGYEDDDRRATFAESCYLKMLEQIEALEGTERAIKNRYRYFISILKKKGGLNI